ncbi:MAG: anti-sigma factor antagonist [Anaerolineae bacterium]
MDMATIDVNIELVNGITVIELMGELDSFTSEEAQAQILPQAEKGGKVLLDMSKVTYMSSAGLRTLLLLYRKINENIGNIVIAGLNEEVRDIMSVTGFLDFFQTVETRHAGMQALN